MALSCPELQRKAHLRQAKFFSELFQDFAESSHIGIIPFKGIGVIPQNEYPKSTENKT